MMPGLFAISMPTETVSPGAASTPFTMILGSLSFVPLSAPTTEALLFPLLHGSVA